MKTNLESPTEIYEMNLQNLAENPKDEEALFEEIIEAKERRDNLVRKKYQLEKTLKEISLTREEIINIGQRLQEEIEDIREKVNNLINSNNIDEDVQKIKEQITKILTQVEEDLSVSEELLTQLATEEITEISEESLKNYKAQIESLKEENTELQKEIDQKNSPKIDISRIRHNIKSPLASAQGSLSTIENDAEEAIQDININIDKALEVLTETEKGNVIEEVSIHKITKIIETSLITGQGLAKTTNRSIVFSLQQEDHLDPSVTLQSIPCYIEQTIDNLISNSIKYNDKQKGEIAVYLKIDEKKLIITIKDNGRGMNSKELQTLGTRYTRFQKKNDVIEGNGIGLSGVNNMLEKINGTITFQSEEGQGTSAIVKLPLQKI